MVVITNQKIRERYQDAYVDTTPSNYVDLDSPLTIEIQNNIQNKKSTFSLWELIRNIIKIFKK